MRVVRLCCCLLALIGSLIFSAYSSRSTPQRAQPHASPPLFTQDATALPQKTMPSPIRLLIPSISVNAFVEPVDILPSGDLATPTMSPWDDVGWYESGPVPGERGSTVIDGHLDRPGGYPAVFWHLRDVHVGDTVMVIDAQRKILHFRVTYVALYPPQDAPLQEIFGNNGGNYLNLITCAGDWIPSQHQTTLRLVVYTSLE
jgi:LPXTG-site transpeptidase (sortase) family protein